MAHFAKIENKIVTQVLVVPDNQQHRGQEFLAEDLGFGGTWVQTSYNTIGGEHPEGRPLHKNYAGIGYKFDGTGFFAPQPYPSWTMNQDTYLWEAPVAYPTDGEKYTWDESIRNWAKLL